MTFPTPTLTKEALCPCNTPVSPNKENSFSEGKSKDFGPFRRSGSRGASRRVVAAFSFAPISNFATRFNLTTSANFAFQR